MKSWLSSSLRKIVRLMNLKMPLLCNCKHSKDNYNPIKLHSNQKLESTEIYSKKEICSCPTVSINLKDSQLSQIIKS
jgi:hypothetical protein